MIIGLSRIALIAALLLAATSGAASTTVVMTFDEVNGNYTPFDDAIGDSANVDVTNRTRESFGNTAVSNPSLLHWANNYSELVDIAFPASNGRVGELQFDVDPGYQITFDSFRFGNYFDGTNARDATLRIYDAAWSVLWDQAVTGHTGNSLLFTPNLTGSGTTYYFQWGTDWNTGIDDFTYTSDVVTPQPPTIPLPAGLPLSAGALGMLALLRRRA